MQRGGEGARTGNLCASILRSLGMQGHEQNRIHPLVDDIGPAAPAQAGLHVVHGVLSLELGGLERLVVDLVKSGRDKGYRNSIVCIDRPGQLASAAEAFGAEVHCLGDESERPLATARARMLFERIRPDVLHTHQIGALWHLGRALDPARRAAVVHTEHSDHVRMARGLGAKLRSRWWWHAAGRHADVFCCVSEDIARSVRRWGTVDAAKVCVIANGVDTGLYADPGQRPRIRGQWGIPPDARVIGMVGRLNEVKRQELMLRAFARLQPAHPDLWLLLVGDGPEREPLQALALELGVAANTRFAGYQPRTEHYYPAMDLFALTSRHEGLPLSLLEAWACGLPVVSSAVGGIPRVVEQGRTGLLFDEGDQAALAACIGKVLDQPGLGAALGAAGRQQVLADYSLQRVADQYQQRYRSALAAG